MLRNRRHSGFTAVEMLGATALTAVLMVAVLAVIASAGRSQAELARQEVANPFPAELVDLVRFDLVQARQVDSNAQGLAITGYGALDPVTHAPLHRPARVVYRVQAIGDQSWLVRQQVSLDEPANQNTWTELVLPGVGKVELRNPKLPQHAELVITPPDPRKPKLETLIVLQ